ncbi:hypothetical protein HPP92_016136 [Vanilla planifolia]|uniref:EF-hand domain-containing protein n=1 Tax=Vanilla planifolia TaxID=51239 RepID=A0A835QHH7_VANPL|nr:hypothetical protein HPP92_016723 [Vanilla planifolia]KAG0471568.1 hypothetical protein HPP92_016114 [Vanilla planifolia]KAG0471590.1 hypothetical protein HPP92_016136 [Vanilla planifolia]
MAIFAKMSDEQAFKDWLNSIDVNGDGLISQKELRVALQALGQNFTHWKSWRAIRLADLNRNNFIDGDVEVKELMSYAGKLGIAATAAGARK